MQTAGYLGNPTLGHCHIFCLYFLSCPWTSRQRDRIGDSLRTAIQSFSFCSSPIQTSNSSPFPVIQFIIPNISCRLESRRWTLMGQHRAH